MNPLFALLVLAVVGTACGFCSKAAAETGVAAPGDPQVLLQADFDQLPAVIRKDRELAKEADRRADELEKHGFDFTWVVNIPTGDGSPVRIKLPVVRQADDQSVISLWFEATDGEFAIDLIDPAGRLVVSWRGPPGEQPLALIPGRYVIVVQALNGAHVHGVIGITGPIGRCPIKNGRLTVHGADHARGYWWPYLLVTPTPVAGRAPRLGAGTLLVAPNTTAGKVSEDVEFLTAMATCDLINGAGVNAMELAGNLGTPILMPLFPRPHLPARSSEEPSSDLYLPALTRASLEEKAEQRFKRVDLQLIAMIKAARKELAARGRPVRSRVLMAGFSMSGMFTSRFTVLHPDRVLAAAVGSPGGWPIAPVAVDQDETLRYPVGIADVKKLTGHPVDLEALRRVRFLFFLGDADTNDAAEYRNGAATYRDSYSDADAQLINHLFGETLDKRWGRAERLYATAGVKAARFHEPYHGVDHRVTSEMRSDVLNMFRKALRDP